MILFGENPKESTMKTTRVNKFNKVEGYQTNTWKPFVFLCTSNEDPKKEIKKTSTYSSIKNSNSRKEMQGLYIK